MDDHFYIFLTEPSHCIFETGKRIAPADVGGCGFVNGLKPKLYPYRFSLIQPGKKFQLLRFQAVRSGSDGKCHNRWMGDGFCKNFLQIIYRCVGVGVCLKIGNVFPDGPLL